MAVCASRTARAAREREVARAAAAKVAAVELRLGDGGRRWRRAFARVEYPGVSRIQSTFSGTNKWHEPASCDRKPGIQTRKEKREIDWNSDLPERPRAQTASVCTHVSHVPARAS